MKVDKISYVSGPFLAGLKLETDEMSAKFDLDCSDLIALIKGLANVYLQSGAYMEKDTRDQLNRTIDQLVKEHNRCF